MHVTAHSSGRLPLSPLRFGQRNKKASKTQAGDNALHPALHDDRHPAVQAKHTGKKLHDRNSFANMDRLDARARNRGNKSAKGTPYPKPRKSGRVHRKHTDFRLDITG